MSYREYIPTCVETLFGRPPTKFRAHAIIPESRTLKLDSGRCKCCSCERDNATKRMPNVQDGFSDNENHYRSLMNCPDCRKQGKLKENIVPYDDRFAEKRRYNGANKNKRTEHSHYECYCTPNYENTDEEYYTEERNKMKYKIHKKKNYYSEPVRSSDSPEHSDSDRFCSVCQLWVRSECTEKRDQYSSKRYEDRGRLENRKTKKGAPCSSGFHFVVESCRFCGNRRDNEPNRKKENPCQALQSKVQFENICDLGQQVERCSRSEDFFTNKEENEPMTSGDKAKDSCDDIYKRFAEELAAMERYPEIPEEGVLIAHNSQEIVLNSTEERIPNQDEIILNEKRYEKTNDKLEEYKQQKLSEIKEGSPEKSQKNIDFRPCSCEYARKDWEAEAQNTADSNKSEIRLLKLKCDEALYQLETFKKDIAESKKGKCCCDLKSTLCVVEDCKYKCAQLEKKVVYLQRTIDSYTRSTRTSASNTDGKWEIRQNQRTTMVEKQRKSELTERERPSSRKRDQGRELITANVMVSRKTKSTCPPPKVRNFRCHHMRCFPPEQLPDIPSFRTCPGYEEMAQRNFYRR